MSSNLIEIEKKIKPSDIIIILSNDSLYNQNKAIVLSKKNKNKERHRRLWLGSSGYTLFTDPLKQP